jgi:signal transduction histidine kinase
MTFPSGRVQSAVDRAIVVAGYVVFTVASVPSMLVAGPEDFDCGRCPTNVLLISRDETLADRALALQALLYALLLAVVLVRLGVRWRRTTALERMQLTPVYASGLLTFLLVTVGALGAGDVAWWAAFVATALLPFAFLAGLLRSHVARLDSELRARLQELRTSRTRLVEVGDSERRRLERNLHDGAQGRLIAVLLLLGQARASAGSADRELAATLDRAVDELKTSLAELRELARGLHPPLLTEKGLEPALEALAARAPLRVTVTSDATDRLPAAVEITAYYIVSEALTNVAKYARATAATVTLCRADGFVAIEIADDGIGGADPDHGSGLRGLSDRLSALNGSLAIHSPAGEGTRVHARIPCGLDELGPPPSPLSVARAPSPS